MNNSQFNGVYPSVTVDPSFCKTRLTMEIYEADDQVVLDVGAYNIEDDREVFDLQYGDYRDILNAPTYFNKIIEIRFTVIGYS